MAISAVSSSGLDVSSLASSFGLDEGSVSEALSSVQTDLGFQDGYEVDFSPAALEELE